MNPKPFKRLLLTFCGSSLLVLILYLHAQWHANANNGFKRLFIPHPLGSTRTIDLGFNSFYIAGSDTGSLYLGNRTATAYLLVLDHHLNITDSLRLKIPGPEQKNTFRCYVLNHRAFLSDGNDKSILECRLPDTHMKAVSDQKIPFFTGMLPVSSGELLLKTFNSHLKKSTLTKLSLNTRDLNEASGLLQPTVDGFYSCDGELCQDEMSGQLLFVYRYRNRFIRIDSNLSWIGSGKTIDTVNSPQIKIGSYRTTAGMTSTFSSPPVVVNKNAAASNGLLFVYSGLRASNEKPAVFDRYSVIDVYRIKNGRYLFSLYILKQKGQSMTSFRVDGNRLYTISDQYLSAYQLTFINAPDSGHGPRSLLDSGMF